MQNSEMEFMEKVENMKPTLMIACSRTTLVVVRRRGRGWRVVVFGRWWWRRLVLVNWRRWWRGFVHVRWWGWGFVLVNWWWWGFVLVNWWRRWWRLVLVRWWWWRRVLVRWWWWRLVFVRWWWWWWGFVLVNWWGWWRRLILVRWWWWGWRVHWRRRWWGFVLVNGRRWWWRLVFVGWWGFVLVFISRGSRWQTEIHNHHYKSGKERSHWRPLRSLPSTSHSLLQKGNLTELCFKATTSTLYIAYSFTFLTLQFIVVKSLQNTQTLISTSKKKIKIIATFEWVILWLIFVKKKNLYKLRKKFELDEIDLVHRGDRWKLQAKE